MSTILVIEDEDAIRELIADILENEGYDVLTAEHGQAGIDILEQTTPDLILCDIMMPELTGYDVLNKTRAVHSAETVPFIFLTAKASRSDQRQGMDMGADDYLSKPFTRVELLNAVGARLKKQEVVGQHYQRKIEELRMNMSQAMPHELLTPLNGLIGLSDILKYEYQSLDPESVAEIADGISSSGRRLHRVISNTLLYARLRVLGTETTQIEEFRNHLLEQPEFVVRYAAEAAATEANRQHDLTIAMDNAVIRISETNIQKIVEELLGNACKFSPAGTPLLISGTVEGDRYHLSVYDQGRGMQPEQIQRIGAFQQFERQFYEQQGSGLGLVIVQQLVQLYGGDWLIESTPDEGTCVNIWLPIADEQAIARLMEDLL